MSLRQVHFASVDLELHARFKPGQVSLPQSPTLFGPWSLFFLFARANCLLPRVLNRPPCRRWPVTPAGRERV